MSTADPPFGQPAPTPSPLFPGVGIPSSYGPSPLGPLLPGHEWPWPPPPSEQGPEAITIGPRRPAPGEKGFFYDEESGTIFAGLVNRIEFEQDGEKTIIYCAVVGGLVLTLYVHEQCFYHNADALAYGLADQEKKQ